MASPLYDKFYGYGLGSDGYIAIQKETSKTIPIDDYSLLKTIPVNFDSFIKYYRDNIENKNLLGKRYKRKNDLGLEYVEGQLVLDAYPTLLGYFLSILLGDSDDIKYTAADIAQTKYYEHTWKQILDSGHALKTCMIHQAFGSEIPEQFNFCVLNGMNLECEKGGNLKMIFPVSHGQLDTKNTDLQRRNIFSYPAESPMNWSNIQINEKNCLYDMRAHSMSFSIDLNYRKNEFFLGSTKERNAYINGIPAITLNLNVDANKNYIDLLKNNTYCHFEINIISNLKLFTGAGGNNSEEYHSLKIDLPSCQLNPQTSLEHSEERLTMDLEFDCSFVNDNSDSMFSFIVKDKNETYM